jgi:hypothetical protein
LPKKKNLEESCYLDLVILQAHCGHAWGHRRRQARHGGGRHRLRLRNPRHRQLHEDRADDRRLPPQGGASGRGRRHLRPRRQRRPPQALPQGVAHHREEVLRLHPGSLPRQGERGARDQRHALRRLHHQVGVALPQGEDPQADPRPPRLGLALQGRPEGHGPGGVRRDRRQGAGLHGHVDPSAEGRNGVVQGAGECQSGRIEEAGEAHQSRGTVRVGRQLQTVDDRLTGLSRVMASQGLSCK